MPNTSSAKKALRQSEKRRVHNLRIRRALRTLVKRFEQAPSSEELPQVQKHLDKAVKRGILKANTASRRKSRLAKLAK